MDKIICKKTTIKIISKVEHRCLDGMKDSHQLCLCGNDVLVMEDEVLSYVQGRHREMFVGEDQGRQGSVLTVGGSSEMFMFKSPDSWTHTTVTVMTKGECE